MFRGPTGKYQPIRPPVRSFNVRVQPEVQEYSPYPPTVVKIDPGIIPTSPPGSGVVRRAVNNQDEDEKADNEEKKDKEKHKIAGLDDDPLSEYKKSKRTVQIRKTIYSAAALNTMYWPTAFMTFFLQLVILALYFTGDVSSGNPFQPLGWEHIDNEWQKFLVALGRFVSYVLISSNATADLQNAMNLMMCTHGCDKVLGVFQLFVCLSYPLAWVSAIRNTPTIKDALGATGILTIFLKLDDVISSLLDLGVLKREIGSLVYTIENPLEPGVRERWMNIAVFSYAFIYFIYAWVVAMNMYWPVLVLWISTLFFFFRAFYDDITSDEGGFRHVVTGIGGFNKQGIVTIYQGGSSIGQKVKSCCKPSKSGESAHAD